MDQPARETADPAEAIPPRSWHSLESGAALEGLRTEPAGLSDEEAAHRLQTHGPNCLPQKPRRSPPVRFLVQFHNLLIYVLLAAAVLAAAIGHGVDAVVIFAVVVINAAIGFVQEGRPKRPSTPSGG